MAKLIYVEASPLKERSHTIEIARTFLEGYREANPGDAVETVDLWAVQLPAFDGAAIEAKFAVLREKTFTAAEEAAWNAVRAVSHHFNSADKYVFSTPMWNFGVPYRLKHYIDVITLAGENWTWSREHGYRSLLSGKKALLIYSSAGAYPLERPGDPADFQKPFLRHWLSFIGVRELMEINVAPTLADPAVVAQIKSDARHRAATLARSF